METVFETQAAFADRHGVSRQYVNKLVRQGKLPFNKEKRRIPAAEAEIAWKEIRDPAREAAPADQEAPETGEDDDLEPGNGASSVYNQLHKARTARALIDAQVAQLNLRRQKGELVEVAAVQREVEAQFQRLKQHLGNLPGRVAGQCLAAETEREVAIVIDEALREILTAFTDGDDPDAEDGDDVAE